MYLSENSGRETRLLEELYGHRSSDDAYLFRVGNPEELAIQSLFFRGQTHRWS
jgi:hypothetical protein